jgi:hypothetical protein
MATNFRDYETLPVWIGGGLILLGAGIRILWWVVRDIRAQLVSVYEESKGFTDWLSTFIAKALTTWSTSKEFEEAVDAARAAFTVTKINELERRLREMINEHNDRRDAHVEALRPYLTTERGREMVANSVEKLDITIGAMQEQQHIHLENLRGEMRNIAISLRSGQALIANTPKVDGP